MSKKTFKTRAVHLNDPVCDLGMDLKEFESKALNATEKIMEEIFSQLYRFNVDLINNPKPNTLAVTFFGNIIASVIINSVVQPFSTEDQMPLFEQLVKQARAGIERHQKEYQGENNENR